ncbi:MAG TPA: DNA glycosylase [Opitutaceae bacterium]
MPSSSAPGWTEWAALPSAPATTSADLAEQLDGGQAFRWNRTSDGVWTGGWSEFVVRLRLDPNGRLQWSAPASLRTTTPSALTTYLGLEADASAHTDALPWRSDAHLAACLAAFPGLRILRQPFGETLLGFLCSATKQIVQIKQMMALLARRHGQPLGIEVDGEIWHRLPTWDELAQTAEADLRACLLGFRARYIHQTALFLAANPGWIKATETAPYPEAKARLCTLPGVGEKVADCVLLFGAGRLEAFPVDTWILKALARRYGLDGWKPAQVAQFGRAHFGPLAGLAQQYLFAYERAESNRGARAPV